MQHLDAYKRPLRSLRLSVTDRCNLRCRYCMPERDYRWIPREELLTFEELATLADLFCNLGVRDFRLTGGEPLLRTDLHLLIAMLAARPRVGDLALTTNGVLLDQHAAELRAAGLNRVTISLDTLRADRYRALAGRDELTRTLAGVAAARTAGFAGTKVNTVVIRGINDDELTDLLEYGREHDAEVRFIEYMDVGGATKWGADRVVSRAELLERLTRRYGAIEALDGQGSAPAQRFALPDGARFGIVASTTQPFCRTCDRARLTADGMAYWCLYATAGMDLRALLRGGVSGAEIQRAIAAAWSQRVDRGAEERAALRQRGPSMSLPQLRADYHLEMHTKGG